MRSIYASLETIGHEAVAEITNPLLRAVSDPSSSVFFFVFFSDAVESMGKSASPSQRSFFTQSRPCSPP